MTSGSQADPVVAVVIATFGRPQVVTAMVEYLIRTQTLKPAVVIVSCVTEEDAGEAGTFATVKVVTGEAGSSVQRNAGLAVLPATVDFVVFFDDDFVPARDWLAVAAHTFREQPSVISLTGNVLVDDIKGPGLSFEEAVRIVESTDRAAAASLVEPFSPYGCNMAFRLSAVGDIRFDERLVLYGWLEDRDFGARVAKRGGRAVKCMSAHGVHMGVKRGRGPGDRLGYSQIVNPLYMLRKGTMSAGEVLGQIFRNVASNAIMAVRPEPFVDRRGRLRGNMRGFADVLRGRLEPERAAEILPTTKS
jgi:GT2 family glycosyltransferase